MTPQAPWPNGIRYTYDQGEKLINYDDATRALTAALERADSEMRNAEVASAERDKVIQENTGLTNECAQLRERAERAERELLALQASQPNRKITMLTAELSALKAKHEELLSYLPKVPTESYERDMARALEEGAAEIERLTAKAAKLAGALEEIADLDCDDREDPVRTAHEALKEWASK